MVDIIRLHNYKASMEVYASTQGFEEEALGALIGLTLYGSLDRQAQEAWTTAAQRAVHYGNSSGLSKSMFYSSILQKRLMCFGSGIEPDYANFMYESFPWGLPDKLFYQVYGDLKEGKGKAHETEYSWKDVSEMSGNLTKRAVEYGPVTGLVAYFANEFVQKYAPQAYESLTTKKALVIQTTIAWAAVETYKFDVRMQNADTLQRYNTDAERRAYDHGHPLIAVQ